MFTDAPLPIKNPALLKVMQGLGREYSFANDVLINELISKFYRKNKKAHDHCGQFIRLKKVQKCLRFEGVKT